MAPDRNYPLPEDLFLTLPVGIVCQDASGRITAVNPAAGRILGVAPEVLLAQGDSMATWECTGEDGSPVGASLMPYAAVLRTGLPVSDVQLGFRHPDSREQRWIRVSAVPVPGPGTAGQTAVYSSLVDITDMRRAEERLLEAEGRSRKILEESPLGVHLYRLDDAGRLVFVGANRAADSILGIAHSQLVGRVIEDAFPSLATTDIPGRYLALALAGGRWFAEQVDYQDDQIRGAFEVRAFGFAPGHMAALFMDITERKRTEQQLRDSSQRLDLALTAAGIGTFERSIPQDRLVVDDRFARMLGHDSRADVSDLRSTDLAGMIHPEDLPGAAAAFDAHQHGETSAVDCELRIRTRRGAWTWVQMLARILEREPDGSARRWGGVLVDIEQRKRTEAERASLQAQFLQAQKLESLGVLAGGIAHDFNNLLCGVLGASDLALARLSPNHPVREMIAQIQGTSQRAAELCRQLLAYAGKGRFLVVPTDLSALVEGMGHLLTLSIGKKAVLRYHLAAGLPSVNADATQIRQILLNLVVNAAEAIGVRSGLVTISTGAITCDEQYLRGAYLDDDLPSGTYVFLEVADTGVGMDEDTRARLFDPFFSTKFTGRGLGLAAVLGIVRGHRGTIKVYSEPGRGSCFKVLLPASGLPAAELATQKETPDWRGEGTVLVVDDEDTVRTIARVLLEHLGFSVLTADDGREGLEVFRRERARIRLVILDMTMPHLGGEETFRELRQIDPSVRVLLTSGYNEQEATSHFAGKGLAGFLQKPFSLDHLKERVRAALDNLPATDA
jgi:signal transduction histidine kinase/CheY-like chemotaxis protein